MGRRSPPSRPQEPCGRKYTGLIEIARILRAMRVVALTAHGRCSVLQAEALVLDWFESVGLDLAYGQDGVLIGWSEPISPPRGSGRSEAVEVRFYALPGGWLQVRWTLRLAGDEPEPGWTEALWHSLRGRLAAEPLWRVDGP